MGDATPPADGGGAVAAYAALNQYDVPLGGDRLHTVDVGSGPPVILVHGSPVSSFSFRHQIAALAQSHRVIAPDLLGFGQSSVPPGGAGFARQAGALRRFVDWLDPGPFALVGHDWGGPIGLAAVAHRAAQLRELVLINTTLRPDFTPPAYWKPFTASQLGEMLLVRLNVFGRGLPALLDAARADEVKRWYAQPLEREGTRRTVLALERLEGYDAAAAQFTRAIEALRADVLIVWGQPDVYFRQGELDYLTQTFPAARVREIPGGGHFPQEDAPAAVTEALIGFLRKQARPA